MALTKIQAQKWAGIVEAVAQEASILSTIANGQYQADAAGANLIRVSSISTPSVGNYTSGQLTYGDLTDDAIDIAIDQKKVFTFKVEDIDKAQSSVNVKDQAIKQAGMALALEADKYIFAQYAKAGYQINDGATPTPGALDVNSKNVEQVILDVQMYFDEHNVGSMDRFLVVAPWFKQKMVLAGLTRQTGVGDEVYLNGYIGQVFGFKVYVSNQLTAGHMLAMSNRAVPFVSQINTVESLRLQNAFADAVRGLYTFGADVLFEEEFVDIWVAADSE
jgi:hypothetical protein